jgi:DTW domain-containing protein
LVTLPFDVCLIQHAVEANRPTNTGRMLHAMLPESRMIRYGLRQPLGVSSLEGEIPADITLLFPDSEAPILSASDLKPRRGKRFHVVLLDGTWAQASHMRRRIQALRSAPCARLPAGPPGRWKIRCSTGPERLCTLEAGIRLVRLAGKQHDAARMDSVQDLIMARMLYMKGRLSAMPAIPKNL